MINIELKGVPEIVQTLQDIPRGAEWSIRNAIKTALSTGRTQIDRAIRSRYNIRQAAVLAAVGTPHISGFWGTIRTMGNRTPISQFLGTHDANPSGVEVEIVKGVPKYLKNAFQHGNRTAVLERESSDRYPLRTMFSVSVPEMLAERDVEPKIQAAIEQKLSSEMSRLMNLILSGHRPKGVG